MHLVPSRSEPCSRPATVVLVDDDRRVLDALVELIADQPLLSVVGMAHSGSEAAAICATHRPAIAVVDVMMPGGGAEAIEAILAASPATLVVVFTARSDRRTRDQMLAAGAAAVLVKGQTPELGEVISLLCHGSAGCARSPPVSRSQGEPPR